MNRLIMVEGIPGSGKTTTSMYVYGLLKEQGIPVRLYQEGDWDNPSDFAWASLMPMGAYEGLLHDYPVLAETIVAYSEPWNGKMIVRYKRMLEEGGVELPDALRAALEGYEPYDGRVSAEEFKEIHLARYSGFAESEAEGDTVHVFECSFLQNQVNELLGFQNQGDDETIDYLTRLCQLLMPLDPLILYLKQDDVDRTISRVAETRVSPDGSWRWIDHVIRFTENSSYGKARGLKGYSDTVGFFRHRREVELRALEGFPCTVAVFENNDYDEAGGLGRIGRYIGERFGFPLPGRS